MIPSNLRHWFASALFLFAAAALSTAAARAETNPRLASPEVQAALAASAQSVNQAPHYAAAEWSTSLDSNELAELRASGLGSSGSSLAAPAGARPGADQSNAGTFWHPSMRRFAFEAGGGFIAPESDFLGWGGNISVGAGMHFNSHLAGLVEFRFVDTGLSNTLITEAGSSGGDAHIWGFTLDPVYDFFPKKSNDLYATGGGGFYRKVTQFTNPTLATYCDYFFGCYNVPASQVVGQFSSNQGGWNIGLGYYHRFVNMYGRSRLKLFAEARYLDVLSPAVTNQADGLGTTTVSADTKLIPVTFGVAW